MPTELERLSSDFTSLRKPISVRSQRGKQIQTGNSHKILCLKEEFEKPTAQSGPTLRAGKA